VAEWLQLYLAHRCEIGSVFLFAQPEFTECPACHARLDIDHVPEMWRRKGNPRDSHGRYTAEGAATVRPPGGRSTAAGEDGVRPQSERESTPSEAGSLQGLEVGLSGSPEGEEEEEEEEEALARVKRMLGANEVES
jgi:hypothetical protein